MDDNELFKFIKPDDNDKISDMKGKDLQDFIYYLNNIYLALRDSLGINYKNTFGMEIEFEQANKDNIERELEEAGLFPHYHIKPDISLGKNGYEIATPILTDVKKDWERLALVCIILLRNATIFQKAGGHIHVGAHIIENDVKNFMNFLKIWAVYENVIYRFTYGNFLTGREGVKKYAYPMFPKFFELIDEYERVGSFENDLTHILHCLKEEKYQSVNFKHVASFGYQFTNNTIEFRCPNGTLDPIVWQNNLNLFVKLMEYAKSKEFNNDIINERRKFNEDIVSGLSDFNKIYLRQAIELADLLFNNNLDKIYFLRQYLKTYEFSNETLMRAKPFTKTFM